MAVNPMMESARSAAGVRGAGVDGIRAGLKGMEHAAQEIAELNSPPRSAAPAAAPGAASSGSPDDAVEALLELRVHQRQVQASAKVVQSADAMLGFLLDIHA